MLKNNRTLIITGAQGGGKTILAQAVADGYGKSVTVTMSDVMSSYYLGNILRESPDVIIVEEVRLVNDMRMLAGDDQLPIHHRGQEPELVNTPNFIFVMGHSDPIPLSYNDRRFMIVKVKG